MFRPPPVNRVDVNVGERPVVGIPYVRDSNFRTMDQDTKFSRDSSFFYGNGKEDTARLGQSLPSLPDRRRTTQEGGSLVAEEKRKIPKKYKDQLPKKYRDIIEKYGFGEQHECECETPVVQEGSGDCTCQQCGGNAFTRLGKFVKGIAKKTKGVAKVVKGVAKVVKPIADVGAKVASVFKPELAKPLEAISKGAEATEKVASKVQKKSRNLQRTARTVQRQGRRMDSEAEQNGSGMGRVAELMATKGGTVPGPIGVDRQSFIPSHPMNFNKAKLSSI